MHDWYIRSRDLVHRDITDVVPLLGGIREEEQVSAVECGFHRSTDKVRDVRSIRHQCMRVNLCEGDT
jgi:hypothetical protein